MPVSKIDPKVIFASDAPAIDKPPVFSDKTKGWDVARANDGRPEIKQMNKMQQDTDLKILWMNENAVLPYDASIDYPDGAVTLKDGSFKQLSSGSWVEFLDDFADKDAVKRGIANRYDSSLAYNSGERVVLTNGDIVKSTIDGNANDPNVDMTGWVNKSLLQRNRIVYFEDFVSDVTGATDVTAEMQSLLDSHDGDIYAKSDSVFKTSNTLFNRKHNRTIDFHNAKIVNKSNSRYAIVTISPAFTGSTDAELGTFMTERHYGQEVRHSDIINLRYEMSANTGGGSNLGVGVVYGYKCKLDNVEPLMTNGNGVEIRNSLSCYLYNSDITKHRSYTVFLFMSELCEIMRNKFAGGLDGIIVKMNRDGNPNTNHKIQFNEFNDAGGAGYAISGGEIKERVLTDEIYVAGHEIVSGVEVSWNTFNCANFLQKVTPQAYTRYWHIHHNTFKCNNLAGTLWSAGASGNPLAGETLKGGHQFYENYVYDLNSPGNALIEARLNCKVFNNHFFNVKSRYMFYARNTLSGLKVDSAKYYGNNFDENCAIYCGDAGLHGFSTTADVKDFAFYNNTGYIKAVSNNTAKALTSLYTAADNVSLYGNDITYSANSDVTTIVAQSVGGASKVARMSDQKLTFDTTGAAALSVIYGVQTASGVTVTARHKDNIYRLIGAATTARAFVANTPMLDDYSNIYDGAWTAQILNNSTRPIQVVADSLQASAIPTTGMYKRGDYVRNISPAVVANSVVVGWLRITSGTAHTLNTDWIEIKQSIV